MLIIPFDRQIDWKHPPVATLLLALINILIYFGWQSGDNERLSDALDYYHESGLAGIERDAYKTYLGARGLPLPEIFPNAKAAAGADEPPLFAWSWWAIHDDDFLGAVEGGQLIRPDSAQYRRWRALREQFDGMMAGVVYREYGLKTIAVRPVELAAHMFLHADVMHLFGNLFFLIAVGFLVERTFGSVAYLLCYLLAGLGSAGFDFLLNPADRVPGIGASGAISGLMGMYAVLFWTRKIRFFYFFFVVFGFAMLPAITLLPLWIANEVYQLFVNTESNINYAAHLGGLVTGGVIAAGVRRLLPSFSLAHIDEEDDRKEFDRELDTAVALCEKLEYRSARPTLARLHARHPDDERVLYHLHQCSRMDPSSDEYHRLSQQILALPGHDPHTDAWVLETFREYIERARPLPRLGTTLVAQLAGRFTETGELDEAERLIVNLAKKLGRTEQVAALAAALGRKHMQSGDRERGGKLIAYAEKARA